MLCVVVRVVMCAVRCVVLWAEMPIYKGFQCAVRCVAMCAVSRAVRCAANVLLLVATADTAAGGGTGALSADIRQHGGRVHRSGHSTAKRLSAWQQGAAVASGGCRLL